MIFLKKANYEESGNGGDSKGVRVRKRGKNRGTTGEF